MRGFGLKTFGVMAILLCGCATYQSNVQSARNDLKRGDPAAAVAALKPLAEKDSRDRLVYLLDYATAQHIEGDYKGSIQSFASADTLAEQNDFFSVTKTAAAALTNEEMLTYKGESYEKLFISVYQAMNYLLLGQFDDAMVEVRRVNEKITKFRNDGRKDYELNPFANYLGGLLWEAGGRFDDAYISFSDSCKIDCSNPFLPEDLIRMARKSQRMDEYAQLKKQYPNVTEKPEWYDIHKGQIVVLVEQGWGPEKHFAADNRFAKMIPVGSQTAYARGKLTPGFEENSKPIYNVEKVVIKTFDDDRAWAIARKLGGTATKLVVADQVRQKDPLLGDLTAIFLRVTDRADLRQWSTLPHTYQLLRYYVSPGEYELSLQGMSGGGGATADQKGPMKIAVGAGHIQFVFWRTLR